MTSDRTSDLTPEQKKVKGEMEQAFEKGEISNKDDKTLQKYLTYLCTGRVPNEQVRHREIIRGLAINNIQMQRHIDKLNRGNRNLQIVVIVLTAAVLLMGGVDIYTTIRSSKRPSPQPAQEVLSPQSSTRPNTRNEATKGDSSISPQATSK